MEILSHQNRTELLNYLPKIKSSLKEWMFVDIKSTENLDKELTIADIAELIKAMFHDREGKLYIHNDREALMLLREGANHTPSLIAKNIQEKLPAGSCDVSVHQLTLEGIARFEIRITQKNPAALADIRRLRNENIILVADDDMYMRLLVKKGSGSHNVVHEVADGNEVLGAYKKYVPDILFLDIHMPNMDGTQVLNEILTIDPEAYIIMLSADSSRENVALTAHKGAKGFLAKPFTQGKLQEYIQKCPTIS